MVKSSLSGIGEEPLVSVIMNCLNCERYLHEAIESVYAQTYDNWEIIFWDNASTDGSAGVVHSYSDGRLRYFKGDSTVPLGQARNLAIEQSSGELIAFLDCDDLWMPSKLERQVPLFLKDGEVGLVYSDTYFFNEDGMQKRLYSNKTPYRGNCFFELLTNYLISLETAVISRPALDSLDYWFDPEFSAIEEFDLFVRIAIEWKVDFVPETLAKWRVQGDSLTWLKPEAFDREKRVMLDKLGKIATVRERYGEALEIACEGLLLSEAKGYWKKGDGREARRAIGNLNRRSLKASIMWLSTFLPFSIADSAHRMMTGAIRPGKR